MCLVIASLASLRPMPLGAQQLDRLQHLAALQRFQYRGGQQVRGGVQKSTFCPGSTTTICTGLLPSAALNSAGVPRNWGVVP
jgi:hypothetical protein